MVDFLIDNAIWFIVGAIILIMAIIGYAAENSELGKKVMKTNKKIKKEPEESNVLPTQVENIGVATATENISDTNLNETLIPVESIPDSNDAWTSNVDTNTENVADVTVNDPNSWLNNPVVLKEDAPLENQKNLEKSLPIEDSLYNLPSNNLSGANEILPEVDVETLPNNNYENVEVLNVDNEFENVEILNVQEDNPVEDDFSNSLNDLNIEVNNQFIEKKQNNEEYSMEDIWK